MFLYPPGNPRLRVLAVVDAVENAETEEWVGLWGVYVYYCREVDGRGGQDELWAGSYG